jgi:hypothetical protein
MNSSKTFSLLGCSLMLTAFGCEVQQSLGDLPADESTLTGGGGEAGAGTEPTGGTDASGGTSSSGGTGAGSGGSAPVAGNGGSQDAGAPNTAGTGADGGTTGSTGGSGGTGTAGGSSGGKGGGCNSPYGSPPVVSDDAPGCPCEENEPDTCTYDRTQTPYWQIAFTCSPDGEWIAVEDGACFPQGDGGASCVVDNQHYWSGSDQSIQDPFSCNTCGCSNGRLLCTEIGCEDPCPSGTAPGVSCLQCGDTDACLVVETACFPTCADNEDCDGPARCIEGICRQSCP